MGWFGPDEGTPAWCEARLARDNPCGLLSHRGGRHGIWLATPSCHGSGRSLVVIGMVDASGSVDGTHVVTTARGASLRRMVEVRASVPLVEDGHRAKEHGFVTAVALALLWRTTALGPPDGWREQVLSPLQNRLDDWEVLATPVARLVRHGPRAPGHGRDHDPYLIPRAAMVRTVRDVLDPFLASMAGPALDMLQGIVTGASVSGSIQADLDWLDDGTWQGLERSAGLRATVAALPEHLDLVAQAYAEVPEAFAGVTALGLDGVARHLPATTAVPPRVAAAFREGYLGWRATCPRASADAHARTSSTAPRRRTPTAPRRVPSPATTALLALTVLPRDWVPNGRGEWDAFMDLVPTLATDGRIPGDGRPAHAFLQACGRWAWFRDRLVAAAGTSVEGLPGAVRDRQDAVWALATQVLEPAIALATGRDGRLDGMAWRERIAAENHAARLFHGGRSLAGTLERSALWHRDRHLMWARLAALDPGRPANPCWEPGLPDDASGPIEVTCLRDAASLGEEGRRGANPDGSTGLAHCVGGYADRCVTGEARILSLRRRAGDGHERLSTAEVRIVGGRASSVAQHRGVANGPPPPGCEEALRDYLAKVTSGRLPSRPVPRRRPRAVTGAVLRAGYDASRPGAWEAARDVWAPFLSRESRIWDAARFSAEAGFPPLPPRRSLAGLLRRLASTTG